ncbi:Fic family protein [Vibrio crassostreae]|uniref:Fic family protein n=1 Tax=Vibrio crassostreae TaxID=246167 RepID=UPI001B31480D|nr:Fic family protein [Vibrio crassostreae]
MAKTGSQKLAEALGKVSAFAVNNIVMSKNISPTHRTLLVKEGYLKLIVKGWYLFDADVTTMKAGESALWFESVWGFIGQYLNESYGDDYWLSAEGSLDLHTANNSLPNQLVVFTESGKQRLTPLPNGMSVLVLPTKSVPFDITEYQGVRTIPLELALALSQPSTYRQNPISIQIGLKQADESVLTNALVKTSNVASASRIIGAMTALGMRANARKLQITMEGVGFSGVKSENPFDVQPTKIGGIKGECSAATRIRLLWEHQREAVLGVFSAQAPTTGFFTTDLTVVLENMESLYTSDAYHSLSIEGYKVTAELINKVSNGDWNPETMEQDRRQKDALAAKGYHDAFQEVKNLLSDAHREGLDGLELDYLIDVAFTVIYTALFKPCVNAGIVDATDLAGYRKGAIMIRHSMHVPPRSESLMDCMQALKDLIVAEESFAVKAVLGHWLLGFIHPFPDGNGRTSRFIMNLLLMLGGYNWTVVLVERRDEYLAALEKASVGGDVTQFACFIQELMIEQAATPPQA